MALDTIDLHGMIVAPVTGIPAVGTVTFKIVQDLRDTTDNIIYSPQTFTATLDASGEFTITLPVTDDPDITPLDWTYWVYVDTDVWNSGVFWMALPSALGPVAEFADIIPILSDDCTPDGTACAPISVMGQVAALEDEVAELSADVDALEVTVALNSADIATLTADLDTAEVTIGALVGTVNVLSPIVFANEADINTLEGAVVYRNPVTGAVYVGNEVTGPDTTGANPWLRSTPIPYSPTDANFDFLRIIAIDEFGNQVQVFTLNGNGERRNRPSSRTRVGGREFESAEAVGYSTGQFWQASSNPTLAANREPYLGVWGTAAAKPGWAEATRVLSGLEGVSVGGTANAALAPYNTLSAFNYRGLKNTPGAPSAGTWLLNDVVLDSIGVVHRCTAAGTPGTWVAAVPTTINVTAFTGSAAAATLISDGATTGAPYVLSTSYNASENRVWMDGAVVNNGGAPIAGGTVLFVIGAAHAPSAWVQFNERTSTTLSARVTIRPNGEVRLDQSLAVGATCSFDGLNWRKA